MRGRVGQQPGHIARPFTQGVLNIAARMVGRPRIGQLNVDEVARQPGKRTEVGQLALASCPEKQHQSAVFGRAALGAASTCASTTTDRRMGATAPFGHGPHRRTPGAGTDHQQMRAGVIRHQEAAAKGPNHLHHVALGKITEVVRGHPANRLTVMVDQHSFDRECDIVVARPLAIARTGDRILAGMVRAAGGIGSGRQNAERLALEHRKRQRSEVEHDVVRVAVGAKVGHPEVACDASHDRSAMGIEIDVGMSRRPGRAARACGRRQRRRIRDRFISSAPHCTGRIRRRGLSLSVRGR